MMYNTYIRLLLLIITFLLSFFQVKAVGKLKKEEKIIPTQDLEELIKDSLKNAQSLTENIHSTDTSLKDFEKTISTRIRKKQEELGICIPWLADVVYNSVCHYSPIKNNDPFIKELYDRWNKYLPISDYDFCWLQYNKWDHISVNHGVLINAVTDYSQFGFLEKGIILSKGKIYLLKRTISLKIEDENQIDISSEITDLNDFLIGNSKHNFLQDIKEKHWHKPAVLQEVIKQLLLSDNSWFHPNALKIITCTPSTEDYSKLLNMLKKLKINSKERYSTEQLILAEQIYTGGKLDPDNHIIGTTTPEYYFYGFNSQIDGVSCRFNIDMSILGFSTHAYFDQFFKFLINDTTNY